jgi:hypothetical protein
MKLILGVPVLLCVVGMIRIVGFSVMFQKNSGHQSKLITFSPTLYDEF